MTAVAAAAAPKDFIHKIWHATAPDEQEQQQEHAQEPRDSDRAAGDVRDGAPAPRPDSVSPPASAGREYSPPGPPATVNVDQSGASTTMAPNITNGAGGAREEQTMPTRPFVEDFANARASQYDDEYREERGEDRRPPDPPPAAHAPEPMLNGLASASSFRADLEQERHEQDLSRRE